MVEVVHCLRWLTWTKQQFHFHYTIERKLAFYFTERRFDFKTSDLIRKILATTKTRLTNDDTSSCGKITTKRLRPMLCRRRKSQSNWKSRRRRRRTGSRGAAWGRQSNNFARTWRTWWMWAVDQSLPPWFGASPWLQLLRQRVTALLYTDTRPLRYRKLFREPSSRPRHAMNRHDQL